MLHTALVIITLDNCILYYAHTLFYLHFLNNFASTLTLRRPFHGVVIHKSTSEELVPRSFTEDLYKAINIKIAFPLFLFITYPNTWALMSLSGHSLFISFSINLTNLIRLSWLSLLGKSSYKENVSFMCSHFFFSSVILDITLSYLSIYYLLVEYQGNKE